VAALLTGRLPKRARRVCAVISGGNIDLNMAARVIEQGLSKEHRYLVLRAQIPDKPGRLHDLLEHLAERRINLLDVQHRRAGWRIPLGNVEVEMLVETRNASHAREIIGLLKRAGYDVERAERG
jgi:threonine dehydratase